MDREAYGKAIMFIGDEKEGKEAEKAGSRNIQATEQKDKLDPNIPSLALPFPETKEHLQGDNPLITPTKTTNEYAIDNKIQHRFG